jgi:MinD superfamily P-loop ATPase
MTEIAILSGKGGTGKTSLSAAFATLGNPVVVADCDVDAANLHLILQPENQLEEIFITGQEAVIDYHKCTNCGQCIGYCRFDAIRMAGERVIVSETACDGCKLCSRICPEKAILMKMKDKSRWYAGIYRNGHIVHARLAPGEENSGKLVNVVRDKAKKTAGEKGIETIIIDGPPGTGCPVMSSVTGADKAILVTEPTKSGFHDLKRIFELAENFNVSISVVINRFDLNLNVTLKIEEWCRLFSIPVIGRIPFDKEVVDAMVNCQSIVEWRPHSAVSHEIRHIWEAINQ